GAARGLAVGCVPDQIPASRLPPRKLAPSRFRSKKPQAASLRSSLDLYTQLRVTRDPETTGHSGMTKTLFFCRSRESFISMTAQALARCSNQQYCGDTGYFFCAQKKVARAGSSNGQYCKYQSVLE